GHTGGTLDKLESIPGFRVDLSVEQFKRQLQEVGIVLAGQTHDLAPADGRLYALRDVTATVASPPLIASSIMSKKIAAGADAIVLDVKVGRGAFMQTEADALALAETMVEIGQSVGRKVSAVIADMSQPLGTTVGNALEVMEAIAALRPTSNVQRPTFDIGHKPMDVGSDFREHGFTVAAELLQLVGRARDADEAKQMLNDAIASGRALQKFREWIAAQGGDAHVAADFSLLPRANVVEDVPTPRDGYVTALDALAVGTSAMRLGAGRMTKGDTIDPAVGVVLHKKIGDRVMRGEPLFTIHANDEKKLRAGREELLGAYSFADEAVEPPPQVHRIIH
ncbi:MAG: thymidine phosphorylase, partial [Chloroflexi bacterium]|nr:thymidine phosphorylase [Chloroflexota bacterium]